MPMPSMPAVNKRQLVESRILLVQSFTTLELSSKPYLPGFAIDKSYFSRYEFPYHKVNYASQRDNLLLATG